MFSDELVQALGRRLRAYSDEEFDESVRELQAIAATGDIGGYGELMYAAFKVAAVRRWPVSWTSADVVRFVADVRSSSPEVAESMNVSAAENQLRIALGDKSAPYPEMEARGRAQYLMLLALTADYSSREIDELLREALSAIDQPSG